MSTPARPGVLVEASQQVLIDVLPPILVLHLKRFQYDTDVKGVVKINKQITYGPELEISSGKCHPPGNPPYTADPSQLGLSEIVAPARRSAHPTKYKLFSGAYSIFLHSSQAN